jgi:ElaB/YqjD/DUF883 family membrane-anchored ribosome-binding protein
MQTSKTYPHQESGSGKRTQGGASDMADQVADKAAEYAGKAGEQIERAMESADATIRSAADHGREAGERVQEVAGNLKTAVNKSVKDQPMATLAVAGALGFVLGALWKS